MTVTPIVALDIGAEAGALRLVDALGHRCRFYKVGSELFTAAGPSVVRSLRAAGCDVFLDLKFHDIPNTVARAAAEAAALGVRLATVHASGGSAMIRRAVEAAGASCGVLVVTVLTSLDAVALGEAWGRRVAEVDDEVLRLAALAAAAGAYGIVCSGREARVVRERFGDELRLLVPGIRLPGGPSHDQERVVTPREAADAGASYLVLGRAVTAAPDPASAMDQVIAGLA